MFKDIPVPRHILASFILACVLVLAGASVTQAASTVQVRQFVGPSEHYLALGDSLAFGFQPDGDFTRGYVADFFTDLQSHGVQDHLNLGCPGETSSTFLTGGLCPYPSSSQLATAVAYLQAHAGKVSPVTLNIGGNDVLRDIDPYTCAVDVEKFTSDLSTLDANVKTILQTLRKALMVNGHVTGDLVLLNSYNPFQNVCPNTVPLVETLNQHLFHDAKGLAVQVNVFDAFGGDTTPNPNICTYTWMCTAPPLGPDIHPTPLGYQVIADTIEKRLHY